MISFVGSRLIEVFVNQEKNVPLGKENRNEIKKTIIWILTLTLKIKKDGDITRKQLR